MKIAIRRGHQRTGMDGCASGILNEIDVANAYYVRVMAKLKGLGHQVLDVTPPEANRSLGNSLSYGINKANSWGADLFISCHANNAYNSYQGAIGCEVIYHRNSSSGRQYAINVEKQIANLGFKSRGAKADIRGLAEINRTNCPCIIIEPFFLESVTDVAVWNKVGAEGLADAIVKGVTGQTIATNSSKSEVRNTASITVNQSDWINLDGQIGYCTGNDVRVRSSKDTSNDSNILGHYNKGDKIELYRKEGEWYHIYYRPHNAGYISASYVSMTGYSTNSSSSNEISNKNYSTYNGYISGDIIRRLQQEINKQGFGEISVDGLIGNNTINSLPTIRKGAKGNMTRIVQELLLIKGYKLSYGVDGIFGQDVYNEIIKLQKNNGIIQDAILGRNTWSALLKS